MAPYRKLFFLILILVPAFTLAGTAQDPQDAFSEALIAACQEKNNPKVKELIKEHRLWVKPVVNQLIKDRKIRGIDFVYRSNTAFDNHVNPISEVIVVYGVGTEVSTNRRVSGMVLQNIIKFYHKKGALVIIETDFTKHEMLSNYDVKAPNFIKIEMPEEKSWI